MRPANIKSNYSDNLAQKRRARVVFKLVLLLLLVLVVLGVIVYLLFFSGLMDLRSISLNGLDTVESDEIKGQIDQVLDNKFFGYISRRDNIFLMSSANLQDYLLSQFPILKSVEVKKNLPHELVFNFQERKTVGIWCFGGRDCVYFDIDGNTWGSAAKSSGFLISSVDDQRGLEGKTIDKEYFEQIKIFLEDSKDLHFVSGDIIIPQDSFRDFKVNSSSGYPILFSLDSNIPAQLKVLGIFLDNKQKEASFSPQYIDLRIDGRAYYK